MSGFAGYSETGQGGEERGPASFAFSPGNAPQARASGQATQLRAGQVKPKDTYGVAIAPAAPVDRTLEGIVQFADKAFGKQLDELRQANFLKGMQQAASGEALTDIINEQPWYTKIFGPSGAADGARAYTVQAGVASWANQQEKDMAELRKKSPDAIPEYINKNVNDLKTGDTATDVMMGMQIMKDAPTLMKVHARENYKYQQEQSVKARYAAMDAAATSLQTAAGAEPDIYDQYDNESRKYNLYQAIVLKPGEDQASQQASLKTFVQSQALAGNFHVLNHMVNDGIFGDLQLDDRITLEKNIKLQARQHAASAAEEYSTKIAMIQAGARLREYSGEQVDAEYDAINAEYTRKSGNAESVIPRTTRGATVVSAIQAQARYEAEAAKQIAGASAGIELESAIIQGFSGPSTTAALIAYGSKAADVDRVFYQAFNAHDSKTPEGLSKQIAMLAKDAVGDRANPILKTELAQLVNSASPDTIDDNFKKGYGYWKALGANLAGGDHARGVYFSEEASARYGMFDRHLGGKDLNEFGQFAYQTSHQERLRPGRKWNADDKKALDGLIENTFNERAGTWFMNDNNITASSRDVVFDMLAPDYDNLTRNNPDPKVALTEALSRAKAQGLEHFGDYVWKRDPERPPLLSYFTSLDVGNKRRVTELEMGNAMKELIKGKALAMAGDGFLWDNVKDVQVLRGDVGGKPAFQMLVTDSDGMAHVAGFGIEQIEETLKAQALGKLPVIKPQPAAVQAMQKKNAERVKREPLPRTVLKRTINDDWDPNYGLYNRN